MSTSVHGRLQRRASAQRWRPPSLLVLALGLAGCRDQPAVEREPVASATTTTKAPTPTTTPSTASERKQACIEASLRDADPRWHALVRSLCAEWVERDIPGVALAIVEPGHPPFELALGHRCTGEPAMVEPGTPFRYGSVSKTFTASMASGLVAEGQLALDDPATTLLPELRVDASLPAPTLASLLTHRSGLGEIVPAELLALDGAWLPAIERSPAAGPVGSYHYSNTGYALIGAMLETRSGQRYAELLRARIAEPLHLASVTAVPSEASDAACGHLDGDATRQPIHVRDDLAFMPGDPRWMDPAGGVLGSAADLARFALALGTEQLPGSAAMLEPGEALPPASARASRADERYGYGLRSWTIDPQTRAYGHSGNNGAFTAELLFVPGRRAIALLANCGSGLPATLAAAEQALRHESLLPL